MDSLDPALAFTREQAAAALHISLRQFGQLEREGRIGPRPIVLSERQRIYGVDEFRAWIAAHCPNREAWATNEQPRVGESGKTPGNRSESNGLPNRNRGRFVDRDARPKRVRG